MTSQIDIYKTGTSTDRGSLGYYSLLDWWQKEFTKQEQLYILEKYKPMGGGTLTTGAILDSSATVINFLTSLQSWFSTLSEEVISEKILKKAESLLTDETPVLDIHFLYSSSIGHYYKKRKINLDFYELAKQYCLKQIALSQKAKDAFLSEPCFTTLPRHRGYEQLAIILEKEKKYNEAMRLCYEAKEATWNSDWNKRIATLQSKMKYHE